MRLLRIASAHRPSRDTAGIDDICFYGHRAAVNVIPKCLKKHAEELRKIRLSQRRISSAEARRQCERVDRASASSAAR